MFYEWKKYNISSIEDGKKLCDDLANQDVFLYDEDIDYCMNQISDEEILNYDIHEGELYICFDNFGKPLAYVKKKPNNFLGSDDSFSLDYCISINQDILASQLPIVIPMVKDLDPSSFYVNKLENDYNDYERLVDLSKNKSLSPDDLIFIYNQYGREDTDLARQIIDGSLGNNKRWLQDDYDSLETVEQKANFITAISNIKQHDYYEQLFRDGENMLLINDKEPLIKATDKTGILLTGFASFMLLNDEKFICHSIIASKYCNRNDISLEYNVLNYLPAQCFGNINVLDALLTVSPTILKSFDGRNNIQNPGFALFNEKMKDKKFQLELLKSYYTSYLALCMVDESMATDFDYMEKIIQNMFDKEVLKIFNDEFFVEDVPCDRSNKKLQFIKKISNNQANE